MSDCFDAKERPMFRNLSWHAMLVRSTALVGASMLAIPTLVPVMTPAWAQTSDHWTGAASNDWFTAGNWQDGTVPGAGDTVRIDTATPNETVVDGAAATTGVTIVGDTSTGVLTIRNGGTVESVLGPSDVNEIGQGTNPQSHGTVTVTGPGSRWSMNGGLAVNHGTLAIENGGRVSANGTTSSVVTIDLGGNATVTGSGSTFETNDILDVGAQGTGTLAIAGGGVVTSASGVVGDQANSTGTVTVTGPGSRWSMTDGLGEDPPPGELVIGLEGTGTVTVADGGLVSTSGPITIAREAGSTGTLNIGAAAGQAAAAPGNVQAAGIAFGAGTGTINFNHTSSDYVFEPVISGAGSVNQLAGTTILTAAHTYTGPTTINGGTLVVNGSITSPTTVNAGGTLAGTGTISNDVLNAGTVAPGNNSIGALTVTGNYVGQGGTLEIESVLAGNSSPVDQLILDGGQASGSTGIKVTNQGGPGALTSGNGIQVVVAENGATTADGAFSLAAPVTAGAYQYELRRGEGSTEAEHSWYLANHKKDTGPELVPLYRPEATAYSALPATARAQSLAALGTFHERQGDQGLVRGAANYRAWGRFFAQHTEQHHTGLLDTRFDGYSTGLQAGIDALRSTSPSGSVTTAGLFFAYAHSKGDTYGNALGIRDSFAGELELEGVSVGAYWTHMAPKGGYIDAVAMATHYDVGGKSTNSVEIEGDGMGLTASLEAGYPILLGHGLTLEPQAQLIYQHMDFDRTRDAFSTIDFDTDDAVVGRLGLRFAGTFANWRPYLKANLWHHWADKDTIVYSGEHTVDSEHAGTAVDLGGGVVASLGSRWSVWASVDYTHDIDGDEREAVSGTAGLRVLW